MRSKEIKVAFGDRVEVKEPDTTGDIILDLNAGGDEFVFLTPRQARRLAKALRKAARRLESARVLRDINGQFH